MGESELRFGALSSVLLRSIDPTMVLRAVSRLSGSETDRTDALSMTNFLCFRLPNTTESTAEGVLGMLGHALDTFTLPADFLSALIPTGMLSESQRRDAIQWLASWHYSCDLEEQIPDHAPKDTVCIVRAEDVICDLLIQPIDVLQSYLQAFLETWKLPIDSGFGSSVTPQLRVWDPALAAAEIEVTRLLGYDFKPPERIFHSTRARTDLSFPTSDKNNGVAGLLAAGQLESLSNDSSFPWEKNLEFCVDEVWTSFSVEDIPTDEAMVVDPFYGQVYNQNTLSAGAAIYGSSEDVLVLPDRALANYGFLRVPFRAIARHFISSRAEFERALGRIRESVAVSSPWRFQSPDNLKHPLLFRGQTAEYILPRPKEGISEFLTCFYGDPGALEPSLLSSAERRGGRQLGLEALWGAIVHGAAYFQDIVPIEPVEKWVYQTRQGDLVKLALAQHYGLPTPALDVTTDPMVALWFAVHKLQRLAPRELEVKQIADGDVAVMYIFDIPPGWAFLGELSDMPTARPSRQHGAFIPISWGYRRNRVARYLVGALYFQKELAEEFLSREYLFPDAVEDPIIDAVATYSRNSPGNVLLDELEEHLYVVS